MFFFLKLTKSTLIEFVQLDGIIIESPISQASIDEERRCITLLIIFVHIIAPVISGCAVAYYTYWLSKRNK
ncbi:type I toxin-antitoxin system Fst family toxin [Staphylococcus aureus]|nr:type I toxin-antitoxin system Fst family toxin [Staphylococcus aureus]WIZ24663.1 type I toxin-antitoxin system Fst family toxin [Staphylococcus aureus]WIZ93397.1 type I toxin-antitoxin system Fst family toxin [Staphylococcus aureus]WJA22320.1 type I toxin-antitoxin system Fst family toxin [Staphylococcus aureus]WJB45784.1 type I toxin-antitoxin system Fst family toxin [Staphylococcus aureus]